MDGDTKNQIDRLVSSTTDDQEIQLPIKETRDVQMFVGIGNRQVSLVVGDQRQSYIQIGNQVQQPLPVGFQRQSPVDVGFKNQVGVNAGFQRQVPIRLNGRTVELLNMEQFGYNSSFLRKPMTLNVLDATQVNSDYEYGVMQIEDNYEFKSISGELVVDTEWQTITLSPSVIANGKTATHFSLDESELIVTGNIIMLPNIIQTKTVSTNVDVYGLQCLSVDGSPVDWKIGLQSVANQGSALLDVNGVMTKDTDWLDFNTNGYDGHQLASMKVKNLDASGNYAVSVHITTANPSIASDSTVATPGNTEWHECVSNAGTIDFQDIYFYVRVHVKNVNGLFEPMYTKRFAYKAINRDDQSDINWFKTRLGVAPFAVGSIIGFGGIFNSNTFGAVTWHTNSVVGQSDNLFNTMPQCQIILKTVHDGEVSEHSINILKSINESGNSMDFISNDTVSNKVTDWSYATYVNAYRYNGTSHIKPILIKSSDMDFYMITESNSIIGFQNEIGRSLITNYYKMSQISSMLSIGILRRVDNTYQLGVKHSDRFYTAKYDKPVAIGDFKIRDIHIVNSSEASLDFIVNYEEYSTYYSFFRSDMIEGNKLLTGSRGLYLFMSNRIDKLINKDEVVNLYTKSHELPVLQCNIVSTDANVYSKTTKSFSVPLAINGADVKNTMFMVNTVNGLKNSITEINGVGKFVADNFVVYMPNCLSVNMYIGYGSNAAIPLYINADPNALFKHICSIPSYNKELSNFTSAPLKMEDEYPEIYNNANIGDSTFMLGKTRFVSVGGSVYESGSLSMCPNTSRLHIYENDARLFVQSGFFFLAKERQTNLYSYTELGAEIITVIEDKILCNPIKTPNGIVAVGSRGIWLVGGMEGRSSIKKIYSSPFTVEQASLKTNLDNSVIAILDGSDSWTWDAMTTTDDEDVISSDGYHMATGTKEFVMVTINQFGHVSHQKILTGLQSANLIDIGTTSELLIVDLVGTSNINVLSKVVDSYGEATFSSDDVFVLQSAQFMEFSGEPVRTELNIIEVFAKGSGTITVADSDTGNVIHSITVNSVNSYRSHYLKLGKAINMLGLTITVSYGVKVMQRMIGTIVSQEVLNA